MEKELLEYKKTISALTDEILKVPIVKCESEECLIGSRVRSWGFDMCFVNGVRYIRWNSFGYVIHYEKNTLIEKGLFKEDDFVHFLSERRIPTPFVKLDAAYKVKDKLTEISVTSYHFEMAIIPIVEAAMKAPLEPFNVSEEAFVRSQQAYVERKRVMAQSKAYKKQRNEQKKEMLEKQRKEEERERRAEDEKSLRYHVEQIEALGWHVTLTLKENG